MSTIRQLTYVAPQRVEWREAPRPALTTGQDALVRPVAVTRCDLDLAIVNGTTGWPGPFALGHEVAGIVTEVGHAVRHFRPGDRVIVPFQISCGQCDNCRRGRTGNCSGVPFRSSFGMAPLSGVDYGGGLSDLMRVPFADHMLLPQPHDLDAAAAAGIADNVSDGYRSVAPYLQARPGARVLIVGGWARGIAMYAGQSARALGASEVVYADNDPQRLQLARALGLDAVEITDFGSRAPGGPYPIVVDSSGNAEGLAFAVRSTDHDGILHRTYGDTQPLTAVPLREMYGIGLTLHIGRLHARAQMPDVIAHACAGHIDPAAVITRRAPFSEAAEAILDPTIKVVFLNDFDEGKT